MGTELPDALAARYQVIRTLGSGTFGAVLHCSDLELQRDVALKLLHRQIIEQFPTSIPRFEREARLAAGLRSPRLARVLDNGVVEGSFFIVYELIEGTNLNQLLLRRGRPFPVPRAQDFLEQILVGLDALHSAGIVHRDLKPENIMVRGESELVLTDLGLATGADLETLTRTGHPVGTPLFMAPEQFTGGEPAPSWDLYAAALVFGELVTGEIPLVGADFSETLELRRRGLEGGLRRQGLPISPGLDGFLVELLAPEPGARLRDAAAALSRLRSLPESEEEAAPLDAASSSLERATTVVGSKIPPGPGTPPVERVSTPFAPALLAVTGLVLGGLGLGHLLGTGSVGPRVPLREAESRPNPGLPDPDPVATREFEAKLRGLAQDLERDPEVRAAVGLEYGVGLERAREVWSAGRWVFRKRSRDLLAVLESFPEERAGLGPAGLDALSRIQLLGRLLSRSHGREPEAVYAEGLEELLLRRLESVWTLRREPALDGPPRVLGGTSMGTRSATRQRELSSDGSRWVGLRRYTPDRLDPNALRPRLRKSSYSGEAYKDPGGELSGGVFLDAGRKAMGKRISGKKVLRAVEVALEDPGEGDLVLALAVYRWEPLNPALLEIVGREGATRVCFEFPSVRDWHRPGYNYSRQGIRLRVDRRVLPARPSLLRLRAVGIQALDNVDTQVFAEEIYQQVAEGPIREPSGTEAGDRPPAGTPR